MIIFIRLPYSSIFGGVSAMTKKQFQKVNGFSNGFWGWGGEDDDMSNRYNMSCYTAYGNTSELIFVLLV